MFHMEVVALLRERYSRYECLSILGSGAFGTVALCADTASKQGKKKAIKFISGVTDRKRILGEILNHRILQHPHVIQFSRVINFPGMLGIVMEYANRGNLFQYVKCQRRLDERTARVFFQQIVLAVEYCHRKGVVNRDIKLDNILLQEAGAIPIIKLCDFGYSKNDQDSLPKSKVGSPEYMAPEVLTSRQYNAQSVDVWCCGVCLYVMVVGRYPFNVKYTGKHDLENQLEIQEQILKLKPHMPEFLSTGCKNLLQKVLVSVEERISLKDIVEDNWFSTDLSDGKRNMNSIILQQDMEYVKFMDNKQSQAEISRLVDEASQQ